MVVIKFNSSVWKMLILNIFQIRMSILQLLVKENPSPVAQRWLTEGRFSFTETEIPTSNERSGSRMLMYSWKMLKMSILQNGENAT